MATRVYFPSDAVQPGGFTAAPAAGWESHTFVDLGIGKHSLALTKGSSALTTLAESNTGTPGDDAILVQYVSPPLAAQSVTGTVKGQFLCGAEDPDMDVYAQATIRVVSGDGAVVRGTLLAMHSNGLSSEWRTPAGLRNAKIPLAALSPAALSAVAALEGDRIVIELGGRTAGSAILDMHMQIGEVGVDLPENETAFSGAPWMEFSADLAFQEVDPPASTPSGRLSIGLGLGV